MKINFPTLHTYVENMHGIPVSIVLGILHRHWCGPMGVRGLCTEDCAKCADHLREAFQLEEARKPSALLVWKLRNELAAVQEESHVHEFVHPLDAFGTPKPQSEDIFGDLAKLFQ